MSDRRFYSVNMGKSSFARYFLGAVIMTALIFFAIPLSQLLEDVVRQQLPPEVVDIPSEPPPPPPPPAQEIEPEEPPEEPPPKLEMAETPPDLDTDIFSGLDVGTGVGSFIIDRSIEISVAKDAFKEGDIIENDQLDEAAEPIQRITPDYPPSLERIGAKGRVVVQFTVDEKGKVVQPKVKTTTNKKFNQAAITAIKQWKFKPAVKDGRRVKTRWVVPFNFKTRTA